MPELTRQDDLRVLTILDMWDSGDATNMEIRERFGITNSTVQGYVARCLREPDKLPCECKKPENQNGGMPRGWWKK